MAWKPIGAVSANDGEVAIFLPLRKRPPVGFKDFAHAQTLKRGNMTPENFRATYPLVEGSEEAKAQMLVALGISSEELSAAMRMAHTDIAESRNLLKLVRACRFRQRKIHPS